MNPLKKYAVVLAALTFVASASHVVAASAETETAGRQVAAAKAVEAPAVAVKLVNDASKEAKNDIASAVVASGLRKHPAAIASILSSVLKAAPETTEAVINSALDVLPDSSITIVRVGSQAVPSKADLILAIASKRVPGKRIAMEREVATLRGHRVVAATAPAGAALGGGIVTQDPNPGGPPPLQLNAYAGADPGRP